MKQVLQHMRTGKTTVSEVPVPANRPETVLVRTSVSLVSAGTERMLVDFAEKSLLAKARSRPDLVRQVLDKARREGILSTVEAAFNRLDQPISLGYSSSGEIVQVGEALPGLHVGQRVACAGGGYAVHAEYAVVPGNLIAPLPEEVDDESAAFTTLGAIALHGFRLTQVQLGERVAVIGLGLLGLIAVQLARAAGCQVLGTDLDSRRVALAAQFGAAAVERPQAEEAIRAFTGGRGVDAVLICADTPSADPVELAGTISRDRARVIAVGAVGLNIPRKVYYEKELTFINSRSYGPGRYDRSYEEGGQDYPIGYVRWTEGRNLEAFVELLAQGQVDVKPLITHKFSVSEAPKAYDLITGKTQDAFIGVLLTYPHEENLPTEIAPDDGSLEIVPDASPASSPHPAGRKPIAKVTLGVLGAGNFANAVLLPAIQSIPEIEPVAIASAGGFNAQHAARRYGYKTAASHADQVVASQDINTLAVLTRHHLHAGQVLAGLRAGKHVFCEKPLALTLEDVKEISNNVQDEGPLLMVGFNRRFAPLAVHLAEFWQDRQEPLVISYRVNAGFIPADHWTHDPAQGGGRIIGEACHFIDFMTFLAGDAPVTVSGHLMADPGQYQEDNAVLNLKFPDGSIGTLSYLANGDKSFPKERVEVFGAGRVAVLEDFRSLALYRNGQRKNITHRLRQNKGHQAEWRALADAILAAGPPPIPYDQLFGVSRASILALRALRSGETIRI